MKVMILAAGAGKRLLPLTATTPKPLLPVRGIPLIERLILQLRARGFTDIVVNLFHLGEQIANYLGDGSRLGVRVSYSRETRELETGGGIVQALPLLGEGPFVIVNGDNLTDFDFRLIPTELGTDQVHLVLAPRPDWRTKGDFVFKQGRVIERGNSHVYCGIAVVRPELFVNAPPAPFSWNELLFKAVADGRVSGQLHLGEWLDVSTPEQYAGVR